MRRVANCDLEAERLASQLQVRAVAGGAELVCAGAGARVAGPLQRAAWWARPSLDTPPK